MPRFAVHHLPGGGLVVDLQSDFLSWLDTRVVAPLVPLDAAPPPARHLNPVVPLPSGRFMLLTQSMAAVPASALGAVVADLSAEQDAITRAMDMVFQGF